MRVKIILLLFATCMGVACSMPVYGAQKKNNVKRSRYQDYRPYLQFPVERKKFWVSSYYGSRKQPNGKPGFHSGIDLAAFRGTPVTAARDGLVVYAGNRGGYGNMVEIAHNKHLRTRYAHLDAITTTVGKRVRVGALIGKVGATGNVRSSKKGGDPSHLHFEVREHGKPTNPLRFLKKL